MVYCGESALKWANLPTIGYCKWLLFGVIAVFSCSPISQTFAYRYCPPGWSESNFFCYKLNKKALTWQDASKACANMMPGAKLAVPRYNENIPRLGAEFAMDWKWIGIYPDANSSLQWSTEDGCYCSTRFAAMGLPSVYPGYCGAYNTATGSYSYDPCMNTWPSICEFALYPSDGTSWFWDRMMYTFAFNRLYGARDMSREYAASLKTNSTVQTAAMVNVTLASGPTGYPATAVRFRPELGNSAVVMGDSNYFDNVKIRGFSIWSFWILPTAGKAGTLFAYLWDTGDKMATNFYYDGNNALKIELRQTGGAAGTTYTFNNCINPGVWQRLYIYLNDTFIVVSNGFRGSCVGYYLSTSTTYWYNLPTNKGIIFGRNPATGVTWDGTLSCFVYFGNWNPDCNIEYVGLIDKYCSALLPEQFVDIDIVRRLTTKIPKEFDMIGFWPLTDYYRMKEGSGKLYDTSLSGATDLTYEINPWLQRNVFTYTGQTEFTTQISSNYRDLASVALYRSPFTIVAHVFRNLGTPNNILDTRGPLLEYIGPSGEAALTLWLLSNGTLMVLSSPMAMNNWTALSASFFECYLNTTSTYRLSVQYDYNTGWLSAHAGNQSCGNLSIGQYNFYTMNGIRLGYSTLTSPLNISSQPSTSKIRGQLFCLFIYAAVLNQDDRETLSQLCKTTSAMTPMYGGPNNLLYKPNNMRVFWPLGRDLGGTDISGRGHHGDLYRIASTTGPTGLMYSAAAFWGDSSTYTPFILSAGRPEYYHTFGTNNSITYAFWYYHYADNQGTLPRNYYGGIFTHGPSELFSLYASSTNVYMQDSKTVQFVVYLRGNNVWTVTVQSPTVLTSRWLWIVAQISREQNLILLSVNGIVSTYRIGPIGATTSTYVNLGSGYNGYQRTTGKISCFMIYDYAVRADEFNNLQSMCNSTLDFYYSKYRGLLSFPQSTAAFWPLTQRYMGSDISGHDLHLSLSANAQTSQLFNWATGPTGLPKTAVALEQQPCLSGIQLQQRSKLSFLPSWQPSWLDDCLLFLVHQLGKLHRYIYNTDVNYQIYTLGRWIYYQPHAWTTGPVKMIESYCYIPDKYNTGDWIHFTITMRPLITGPNTYAFQALVYFDGDLYCNHTASAGTNWYLANPCWWDNVMLGRAVGNYNEGNSTMSCVTFIVEPVLNPKLLMNDCAKVLSGNYDALIAGHLPKPTAVYPMAAQTEGDNIVNSAHAFIQDVEFVTGPDGRPRSAMQFFGIPSQYFVAHQTFYNYLDVRARTSSITSLYNLNRNVYGWMSTFGFANNNNNFNIIGIATTDYVFKWSNRCYSGYYPAILQMGVWNTVGFHYDANGDSLFSTTNGSLTAMAMAETSLPSDAFSSGSLVIGTTATIPLSFEPCKYLVVGKLNCAQLYDRGLNLIERDLAMKWCSNPDYIGCYQANRIDAKTTIGDRSGMSATKCRNFCAVSGQRFATVERGYLCRCYDSLANARQPLPGACTENVANNNIEEGGASASSVQSTGQVTVSVYHSALTRRITKLSLATAVTLGCPPGWDRVATSFLYCYRYINSAQYYDGAAASAKSSSYGFQSALMYPEDATEEKIFDLYRLFGDWWLWIGCRGGYFFNPSCTREDGKRLIGYSPVSGIPSSYYSGCGAYTKKSTTGKWVDVDCNSVAQVYVIKAPVPQIDVCPRNSTRVMSGNCFMFVKKPMTFQDAEAYCQSYSSGGHLATIINYAQLRLILNVTDRNSPLWIGLNFTSPGNWSWIGYNLQSTFTFWAMDFSPNAVDMAAPCVYADSRSVYQWRTAPCNRLYNFICEFPPDSSTRKLSLSAGGIPDYAITSSLPGSTSNSIASLSSPSCWIGRPGYLGSEYVQFDYTGPVRLLWVYINSCYSYSCWLTQFQLNYSMDGINWSIYNWTNATYYKDGSTTLMSINLNQSTMIVLPPLTSSSSSVKHVFNTPIVARYVRIVPLNYSGYMCMTFDVSADIVPATPDIRANTFFPLYIDTYRETGMAVMYKVYVYRLGFSPNPQLYSGPDVIKYVSDFAYAPRLIGAQRLLIVASDAEGREVELPIDLQLETRTRSMAFTLCPSNVPAGILIKCFVRLVGGSNFTMTTTYGIEGLGLRQYQTRVIATRHEYGLISAKPNSTGDEVSFGGSYYDRVYMLVNFPFEKYTTVHAIEADMSIGGRFSVHFYQPECTGATTFCMRSYKCIASNLDCNKQPPYDAYNCPVNYQKCQDRAGCCSQTVLPEWLPANRNFFTSAAPFSYRWIEAREVWLPGIGLQIYHFPLNSLREYPPGTVMAYSCSNPTVIAMGAVRFLNTNVTTFSFPILGLYSASTGFVVSPSQMPTSHSFTPMIRAITLDSTTFAMHINWRTGCGVVPFTAKSVDAMWPDNTITVTTNVTVTSPCGKPDMILPIGGIFAQTPVTIQLTRMFDCNCHYELTWGDNIGVLSLGWAPLAPSMAISRNFPDAGIYSASIRVWNQQNDTSFQYTINVLAPVGAIDLQFANQPAVPIGQPQSVNLVAFASSSLKLLSSPNVIISFSGSSNATFDVFTSQDALLGGSCLPGWTAVSGRLCLLFVNKSASFGDAEFYCASLSSTLAYAPASLLISWADISSLAAGSAVTLWTGLTRQRSRNGFWVPMLRNEPGTINGVDRLTNSAIGSDCVALDVATGLLIANSCSQLFPFVCQSQMPNYKLCSFGGEQWTPYGSSCFRAFTSGPGDMITNSLRCRKLGAVLAAPKDSVSLTAIANIASTTLSSSSQLYLGIWRGATLFAADTMSNVQRLASTTVSGSSSCISLNTANGQLVDTPCSTSLGAMCERPFASETKASRYYSRLANRLLIRDQPKTETCPSGWTSFGGLCYSVFTSARSLQSASSSCPSGSLAVIKTQADNTFVQSLISSINGVTSAWIGLATGGATNSWLWLDGSGSPTSFGYNNWAASGSTPLTLPAISGAVMAAAGGTWTVTDSTAPLPYVCVRKPSNFGYERTYAGDCPSTSIIRKNGTCFSQPASSPLVTAQQASTNCRDSFGGSIIAPSNAAEWENAMSMLFTLQWNGPSTAAWTGISVSGGVLVLPNELLSGSPPLSKRPLVKWAPGYVPDLSVAGCVALFAEGGAKIVSCSTSLPAWCQSPAVKCPIGWTIWGGSCYKATEVAVATTGLGSPDIALTACELLGGYPVSIGSSSEQAVVRQLVPGSVSVLLGQYRYSTQSAAYDAAGRAVYNPNPLPAATSSRAYLDGSNNWLSILSVALPTAMQTICQRPSSLTPDDCAVACMTSLDPICSTFEYHGDYCLLFSDVVTKLSYGLRNANGASDLFVSDAITKNRCTSSLLGRWSSQGDVQFIGNDSTSSPSDVIAGSKLKGFVPLTTSDTLQIMFSSIVALTGFSMAPGNGSTAAAVLTVRFECASGLVDSYVNCFPGMAPTTFIVPSPTQLVAFPSMIVARRLRIIPEDWNNWPSYQLELSGCQAILAVTQTPQVVFDSVGDYTSKATIAGSQVSTASTTVQQPVGGISIDLPIALNYGHNASLPIWYLNGTEATVNSSFANVPVPTQLDNIRLNATMSIPASLVTGADGLFQILASLDNAVSDPLTFNGYVFVEIAPGDLMITSNQTVEYGTLRDQPVQFFLTTTNCSRCMLNVIFHLPGGQLGTYSKFFYFFSDGSIFSDVIYSWNRIGLYAVEFSLANNISNVSAVVSVGVENPAKNFFFDASTPNAIPRNGSGLVKMQFSYSGAAIEYPKYPANPLYQVLLWNGTLLSGAFSANVPASGMFFANLTLLTFSWGQIGSYPIVVTISNNVTVYNHTEVEYIEFAQTLADLKVINLKTPFISTGSFGNFSFEIAWGIPWQYQLVIGSVNYGWQNATNDTLFVKSLQFNQPGTYIPKISARNAVSSLGPMSIDVPIKVETPITPYAFVLTATPKYGQLLQKTDGSPGFTTDPINLTVWYNTTVSLPSDLLATLVFGDGHTLDQGEFACDGNLSKIVVDDVLQACMIFTYSYTTSGNFIVKLSLHNSISKTEFSMLMPVYFMVPTNLVLQFQFRYNATLPWRKPFGPNKNYLPSGVEVNLYSNAPAGALFQNCWGFGDGTVSKCPVEFEPTPLNEIHVYTKDSACGAYLESCDRTANLTLSSPYDSAHAEATFYVEHATSNPMIVDDGPGVRFTILNVKITYDRLATDACIFVDFGSDDIEGPRQVLRGSEYMCALFYKIDLLRTLRALTDDEESASALFFQANYTRRGKYYITASIRNMVEYIDWQTHPNALNHRVLITGGPCRAPTSSVQAVPFVFRSQRLEIGASAQINCTSSIFMSQNWTMEFADSPNATTWADVTKKFVPEKLRVNLFEDNKGLIMHDLSLSFEKKSLPIGFYRFTLQLDMPEEELLNKIFQFITEVRRTPLVASFNPATSYVDGVFGVGNAQEIDAATLSYDPDVDDPKQSSLKIYYFCKRSCEGAWPSLNNYAEAAAFVANPKAVWTPSTCVATSDDMKLIGGEKLGCFFNGWHSTSDPAFPVADKDLAPSVNLQALVKRVTARDENQNLVTRNVTAYYRNSKTAGVVFETAYMFENETFNMLAVVMDPSTSRFSLASQAVRLEKGDPPRGYIKPIANCGYSYRFGCLMNPTSRMTMRRVITNFAFGRLYRYHWYLAPVPLTSSDLNHLDVVAASFQISGALEGLETIRNWTNMTSTDRYGPDLSFDARCFAEKYVGRSFILVSETQLAGGGRIGRSMLATYVDNPPNATLTTCRVDPSSGWALTTPFSIKCDGFTDLDDPVLKKFTLVAYTCLTCDPTYLTPIPQAVPELKNVMLPAGDPKNNFTLIIRVTVYDAVDAIASVDIYSTKVNARTDMDFIENQFHKLEDTATKSTPDLLVMQLIGFVNILNLHEVAPIYQGNATILNSTDEKKIKNETDVMMKDFDRYESEMKTLRKIRMAVVNWILKVGMSTSSIQSVKSYCSLLSSLQAVPDQAIDIQFDKSIAACVEPSVAILANYSADLTIDPNDMDAAASSCVVALGKLAEVMEFQAKYTPPLNPALTTTTTTTTETPIGLSSSSKKPISLSTDIVAISLKLSILQSELMAIVLTRKGVQESRSVVGGSSCKMSLSSDFVGNLDNAKLGSGGDEDCGSFQLGDAKSLFGPSVTESLQKMGVSANDSAMFDSVRIQLKAAMSTGNAHSSDRDLNSMVQSLVLVDEDGNEVYVKNLPYYMEIMIESQNPTKPVVLTTAAQSFETARTMKPINLPVKRDSAVFVSVTQLRDMSQSGIAVNITCNKTTDKNCKDPYENVTLSVGSRNITVAELNATDEDVFFFVFINQNGMFPRESSLLPNLGCILPHDRLQDELWEISGMSSENDTTTSTTTTVAAPTTKSALFVSTTAGPTITTTAGNGMTTTKSTSQSNSSSDKPVVGPAKKKCNKHSVLPPNTCYFRNDVMNITNGSALLYVGIRAIPVRLLRPVLQQLYAEIKGPLNETILINRTMDRLLNQSVTALMNYTSYAASCVFWDDALGDWATGGCYVGPLTTAGGSPSLTQCFCNHLTTFGSNFDLPMNTFNPADSAFTHLDQNPVCFAFGICVFCLYFTLLIWARRKDREDESRWGSMPLMDNDPRDKYAYEVTIWTGQRQNAGTTAHVSFILIGDEGETAPRMLDDVERPILRRGQVDSFLMTVPRSLGKMNQLRIWHDNSGKNPSWYFSRMMVFDIQRNQQFFFVCDQWLAVEEEDGQVERALPVADKSQLASFEHLFVTRSQRKLTDGHMWISVFSRPPRSAFTRTQRLTCCLSILYCTMLSNIMFFGISRDPPDAIRLELGPIGLSTTKIMISIVSALIVMPVNLVIVQLFRMSRRRLTTQEKKMEAIIAQAARNRRDELRRNSEKQKQKQLLRATKSCPESALKQRSDPCHQQLSTITSYPMQEGLPPKPRSKKDKQQPKKKPMKLPWWCCIVAYVLSAATCGVAFWAIVEYGGALGPDRAIEWVAAMCLSLFTDVLFMQPLKIIAMAMFYALVIKNPTKDEDIEEHMMLKQDKQFLRPPTLSEYEKAEIEKARKEAQARRQDFVFLPPDPDELRLAREVRLKEIGMWRIIKEIASYVIFLLMVMFVAFNNVDEWGWMMQKSVRLAFFDGAISDVTAPPFNSTPNSLGIDPTAGRGSIGDVASGEQFWFYVNHTLLPSLFDRTWYEGSTDTMNGFTKDKAIFLAGILRMRQLRIEPQSCKIPKAFRRVMATCNPEYSILSQDSRNYTSGWKLEATTTVAPSTSTMPTTTNVIATKSSNSTTTTTKGPTSTSETTTTAAASDGTSDNGWKFYSTLKTGSSPSSGELATYDGSGYVVYFPKELDSARTVLQQLFDNRWIDDKTRAIFVEFNLYNPSRSLFAVSQVIFEFPSSGGVVLHPYFYVLKMQAYNSSAQLMTLIIQVLTLVVILVIFIRECMKARRGGRAYWHDFWCVLDFCHLLSCIVWAIMFGIRYFSFTVVAGRFHKRVNAYTNMDLIVVYDFFVAAFAAAIVAVGTLRFIRLLRFSRNIMLMLTTLRNAKPLLQSFTVVFFAIFLAFAQFGNLGFGAQLQQYSTFVTSLETLFAMQLGVFDYFNLRISYPMLGPLFFILYSTLVSIIMTNFLVAFIVVSYQQAYMDDTLVKEEMAIVEFMMDKIKKVMGIVDRRPPSLGIDKQFLYLEEAMHEDEIDRFTTRMDELMTKLDAHLEKTKSQFPEMFDQKTLRRASRTLYVTD